MGAVSEAVAVRDQPAAPAKVTPDQMVRDAITRQSTAFGAVLPRGVDVDRYSRLVLTAVKATPRLMEAFATPQGTVSVLLSAMMAASLGLEPNTPTQECWLQPRNVKDANGRWVAECELSIGYKGYAKLARNTGEVREIVADVVREGDDFEFSRGLTEDTFRHKRLADDAAPLTHAYAIVRLANGSATWAVLNRAQVEKRRAMSESWRNEKSRPYSPWTKWEEEQWRKTAIRYVLTHGAVSLSPELGRAAAADEHELTVGDDGMIDALVLDGPVAVGEIGAGGAATREDADGPGSAGGTPPAPAAEQEPPPAGDKPPAAVPTAREIGALATKAFPCDDVEHGQKTATRDRLRHAVVYAVARDRRTVHFDDLDPDEKLHVRDRLRQIIDGRMSATYDDTGVVFTWDTQEGPQEINVEYSALEPKAEP